MVRGSSPRGVYFRTAGLGEMVTLVAGDMAGMSLGTMGSSQAGQRVTVEDTLSIAINVWTGVELENMVVL